MAEEQRTQGESAASSALEKQLITTDRYELSQIVQSHT